MKYQPGITDDSYRTRERWHAYLDDRGERRDEPPIALAPAYTPEGARARRRIQDCNRNKDRESWLLIVVACLAALILWNVL